MANNIRLTDGGVSKLMRGEEVDKPVFQILGFKKIAGQGGSDRYRLNISDGNHSHTFAMLATQLNHMIPDGQLDNYCIIRAEKVVSNAVSEKRVLIILDLTVLASGSEVKSKIGNPVQYTEGAPVAGTKPLRVVQENAGNLNRSMQNTPAPPKYNTSSSNYGSDMGPAMPIHDINPYNSSKVTIKARVTNKTPIKTWSNSKGDGKLFNIDLLDESGEIRMTYFNQQVDQYYDALKIGHVYMFRNFFVKAANKNFSTLNNDYEITCNNDTQVVPCSDSDAPEIPLVSYDFVDIASIEGVEKDRIIDCIGVCKRRGELSKFTSKMNKEFTKRDLVLVDRTNREINITLWGKQAEDFEDDTNPVIAVKGAKVSDFNGKSLTCFNSTSILLNPDITEAHMLRGWYDNEGMNMESHSLSSARGGQGGASTWKLLREANSMDNAAANEKGDYYMSKVTVMSIKRDNAMYKACPEATCNKKVIDTGNGLFRCEKCNKETGDFKWRAMLSVNFADASDFVWATCFQETAEVLLGHPIEVLGPIYGDESNEQFDGIIKEAAFKSYIVKFRCKIDTYNNENRMKHNVMELHPVNFLEYAKKLMNEIKECSPA